jgi:hypothetical protein
MTAVYVTVCSSVIIGENKTHFSCWFFLSSVLSRWFCESCFFFNLAQNVYPCVRQVLLIVCSVINKYSPRSGSLISVLILFFSHLQADITSSFVLSIFETCMSAHACYMPRPSHDMTAEEKIGRVTLTCVAVWTTWTNRGKDGQTCLDDD